MTEEGYAAAVREYHASFAEDAVRVARSRTLRGTVSVFRAVYRVTGGRLGLRPGSVDLDAVAVQFAAEQVVASAGGSIGDLERGDGWLRLPIEQVEPQTDKAALVAAVGDALRREGLTRRRVIVRFEDGEEHDAIPG